MLLQCKKIQSLINKNFRTVVLESLLLSHPLPWCDAHPSCVPLGWENDSFSPFKRKWGGLQIVHIPSQFCVYLELFLCCFVAFFFLHFFLFLPRDSTFFFWGSQLKPESGRVAWPSPSCPQGLLFVTCWVPAGHSAVLGVTGWGYNWRGHRHCSSWQLAKQAEATVSQHELCCQGGTRSAKSCTGIY